MRIICLYARRLSFVNIGWFSSTTTMHAIMKCLLSMNVVRNLSRFMKCCMMFEMRHSDWFILLISKSVAVGSVVVFVLPSSFMREFSATV